MEPFVFEARAPVAAAPEIAFDALASIGPREAFARRPGLPEVVGVEEQTGDWTSVGDSRILRLADGGGMLETLLAFDRPREIVSIVTEVGAPLRRGVGSIRSSWRLESRLESRLDPGVARGVESGASPALEVVRRCVLAPRSVWTRPIAGWLVRRAWPRVLTADVALASERIRSAAESRETERQGGRRDG